MSARHHYVSKFHLKQFLDPNSLSLQDPWLWLGFIRDGRIERRAPKNVGTAPLLFDGPGGLANRDATLESFLSHEVESPAAEAMREVCRWPSGTGGALPPPLARYLAWAAARSLPMQSLENSWYEKGLGRDGEIAEPPPEGLLNAAPSRRDVQMRHLALGCRVFPAGSDVERAAAEGWFPDMRDRTNFLEGVQIQAHYFQIRFFPRFKWFALHAPRGEFFIIADRAVGWTADGYLDAPPACLRHPSAYVLAPISKDLVLVGRHTTERWQVTPSQINAVIACGAHEWIAGPTRSSIESAMELRRSSVRN